MIFDIVLDLRPASPTLLELGQPRGDMTGGQISYHLRRLRAYQIIERILHSHNYQVTPNGLSTALFFTRLTRRIISRHSPASPAPVPCPAARCARPDRAYKAAIADLGRQASLGI